MLSCSASHVLCRGAGTDANVFLELRGTKGGVGECRLDNASNNFERGKTDSFVVKASDIGELTSIVIRHDNAGGFADWHLQQVCDDGQRAPGSLVECCRDNDCICVHAGAALHLLLLPQLAPIVLPSPYGSLCLLLVCTHLQVEVIHPGLGKTFAFPCNDWLKAGPNGDLAGCKRELAAGVADSTGRKGACVGMHL